MNKDKKLTKKKLEKYMKLKEKLTTIKQKEMSLRLAIASIISDGQIGTNEEIVDGLQVTCTISSKFEVNNEIVDKRFIKKLSDEESACLKENISYSIVKVNYDKLQENSALHDAVTMKPNTPVIKIESVVKAE